jgi:hypothetical protein
MKKYSRQSLGVFAQTPEIYHMYTLAAAATTIPLFLREITPSLAWK